METPAFLRGRQLYYISGILVLVVCLSVVIFPHLPVSAAGSSQTTAWRTFGFTPSHTHDNPYETSLSPATISQVSRRWSTITLPGSFVGTPIVVNNVVYTCASASDLAAFNATTGAVLWQAFYNVYTTPTLANGILYVNADGLFALTPATGKLLWSNTNVGGGYSSPTVAGGTVYLGSVDSRMVALNAQTGALLWSVHTDGGIQTSPAVINGIVYAGSDNGEVYAFNATTGALLWSALTGGAVISSPAVVGGIVYIGSNDGNLYAASAKTGKLLWFSQIGTGNASSLPPRLPMASCISGLMMAICML